MNVLTFINHSNKYKVICNFYNYKFSFIKFIFQF